MSACSFFSAVNSSFKVFLGNTLVAFGYDQLLEGAGSSGFRVTGGGKVGNFTADRVTLATVTTPFTDFFPASSRNQLDREDWVEQGGNFLINVNQQAQNNSGLSIAVLSGLNIGAQTISAEVDIAMGVSQTIALLGRYSSFGEGNGYAAEVSSNSTGVTLTLYRRTGATRVSLGSASYSGGFTGTLTFTLSGSSLSAQLGTNAALTAIDGMFGSGSAGFRATGTGTVIDTFAIS